MYCCHLCDKVLNAIRVIFIYNIKKNEKTLKNMGQRFLVNCCFISLFWCNQMLLDIRHFTSSFRFGLPNVVSLKPKSAWVVFHNLSSSPKTLTGEFWMEKSLLIEGKLIWIAFISLGDFSFPSTFQINVQTLVLPVLVESGQRDLNHFYTLIRGWHEYFIFMYIHLYGYVIFRKIYWSQGRTYVCPQWRLGSSILPIFDSPTLEFCHT